MCGIAGYLGPAMADPPRSLEIMTAAISHRGPDASGHWYAPARQRGDAEIGLGHRRLSILDLSESGAQPMTSENGRHTIAFNGEIYNFLDMRAELDARGAAPAWRGRSDTEVLLAWIVAFGVDSALNRVDGMFAFALWSHETGELILARDAFGEKPLYWGLVGRHLLFGSELRALTAMPGFDAALDYNALGDFFKYSYIPAPLTIWQGIAKLEAGQMVRITPDHIANRTLPSPVLWWDPVTEMLLAAETPFAGTEADAAIEADRLLLESVRRRLVSDVPLGAFLSGGVDSSMTTALMTEVASGSVKTFSIGVAEQGYDESASAAAIANYLGTDHHELILTPAEVQAAIPTIAHIHDEPFADSSQVPTYLVSRMARSEVTVVLSGDGGDEIFGGYNRYFHAPRIWNRFGGWPTSARSSVASILGAMPMGAISCATALLGPLAPRELKAGRAAEKIQKLARILNAVDETAFHDRLLTTANTPASLLASHAEFSVLPERLDPRAAHLDLASRAMLLDTRNFLPDDVLTKVDRASMAVSLECRTPYLERDLFRFSWSLPLSWRCSGNEGKKVLKQALYSRIPQKLLDRPKSGFAIPLGRWLQGDMRDWAEATLSESALKQTGLLNVDNIRDRWNEHLSGRCDHETLLWNVLAFQAWQEKEL